MEIKYAYKILVGQYEGKIPVGRPRRGWKDNTKTDVGRYGLDETGSKQNPTASYCIHGNEPSDSVTGKEFLDSINDYQSKKKKKAAQATELDRPINCVQYRRFTDNVHKAGTNSATSDATERRVILNGQTQTRNKGMHV
jgi:hypothetical protein